MSKHKINFKRFLAILVALSMVFSTNAFAIPINLTDTPADASITDTLEKLMELIILQTKILITGKMAKSLKESM